MTHQQKHQQQQDFSAYRTIRLETSHLVINTDLYPRPKTVLRDYRVLSWVFSEAPNLEVTPGSAEALDFLVQLYAGWSPEESEKELTLNETTQNVPSFIQTQHLETNRSVLEQFFSKYMEHYDYWAEEATPDERQAFRAATILKDVMYQHAFAHRPEQYNVHEAYVEAYQREFTIPELDDDVTWKTPLCTESEHNMASTYLSDRDIAAIEDYVGAILQLLDWSSTEK